jgi:hypothetical protein
MSAETNDSSLRNGGSMAELWNNISGKPAIGNGLQNNSARPVTFSSS